jgi:serine/alanine adding enzyme
MSFFQSKIYYQLMDGVPGVQPFILKEELENRKIAGQYTGAFVQSGGSLTRKFTSRILMIDEPLVFSEEKSGTPDSLYKRLLHSSQQFKDCIYTEIRFLQNKAIHFDFSKISNCEYNPYLNIIVDTSQSEETLFRNLSESKRRQIRMSQQAGATIKHATTEDEVRTFYNILRHLYRTKVKKPLYPYEFFLRFFRMKESGVILLAYHNDMIIGGILCPIFQKEEMYEWYIAGLDTELQKKRIYPSVMLTWEALRYASMNNIKQFNFMGAGKPDVPYGVRNFKSKFGGEIVETSRYFIIHKPLLYQAGKFLMNLGMGILLNSE